MSGSLLTRFAVRSLGRNLRRTSLSVIGIGMGCALAVFIAAFLRAGTQMRVQAIANSGFGHLRVAPAGWEESRKNDLRLAAWRRVRDATEKTSGVLVVAPHNRLQGLLAFGTRVTAVEVLGVEPPAEVRINRLAGAVSRGRYLQVEDEGGAVVGATIAQRLDVELGDDLLLTALRADGEMVYAMLRIVGVIDTGSRDLDASICHVTLGEMARITGSDEVAELTVKVRDPYQIDAVLARLKKSPAGPNQVLTWEQILPAHGIDAASDRAFMNLFVGIVIIVVVLGVASAQLTAILERRKEFAVLLALGMKATQVIRLVAFEAVALGLFGAAVGLLLGGPLVYYTSTQGIDFGALMEGELAVSGVLFDPVLYTEMGLWIVPRSLWVGMAAALAGVIYPAWYVLRTNPSAALGAREV